MKVLKLLKSAVVGIAAVLIFSGLSACEVDPMDPEGVLEGDPAAVEENYADEDYEQSYGGGQAFQDPQYDDATNEAGDEEIELPYAETPPPVKADMAGVIRSNSPAGGRGKGNPQPWNPVPND